MKTPAICGILAALLVVAAGAGEHHEGRSFPGAAPAPGPMVWSGESLRHHHHKHAGWAAAAPGPDARRHEEEHDPKKADLLFILSADQAEFTAPTTLQLTGVTSTAQFHDSYEEGSKAGLIRTAVFANGTTGARYVSADGTWLSNPDAALVGSANNSDVDTAVLLTLSNPVYDPATQSVAFTVAVLPAEESALKTHGGVVNGLVMDHANGVGTPLITVVTPGAILTNVALFVDSSKEALHPLAEEKDWWRPWGGWGDRGWGSGWGGWGGGWNGGWDHDDHRGGWGR